MSKHSPYWSVPSRNQSINSTTPENVRTMVTSMRYIVYPPEGPRPPVGSLADIQKANNQMKSQGQSNSSASQ